MFVVDHFVQEDHRRMNLNHFRIHDDTSSPSRCARRVTAIFGALLGNGERPQFLPTRAPPQDFYSRVDRERTTNSSARCVSPPLYPSGTCKQAPVLRSLPFSQHFKLLLLHRLFPLPLETLSERYASPLPLRSTRVVSSYSSNSPPSLRLRSKSCSHYSSNPSMARLTTGNLAWVDENTCDGDHAPVRLSSNLYPISSTVYW
jgi:hypothetical protein